MRETRWLKVLFAPQIALLFLAGGVEAAEFTPTIKDQASGKPITSWVNEAIVDWEASTAVTVSSRAKEMIARQLSEVVGRRTSEVVTGCLATAYLYELRDSKGVAALNSLDAADVNRYSPNSYATQASLIKGMGCLKCISSDPRGEAGKITIDGEAKGNTEKTFALSTGSHEVVIALTKQDCKETVVIEKDKLVEFGCPKKKKH